MANEELAKNRSLTPFGGGTRLYPGRVVAKREIMVFLALVISRFDLAAPPGQASPSADLSNGAGMAILVPMNGHDILVDVSLKEKEIGMHQSSAISSKLKEIEVEGCLHSLRQAVTW
jgi:Cytochrome P450